MKKQIITISRQFGSGGHLIGKMLSEKLNIPFYDSNLLSMAAKKSGISEAVFQNVDETATNSFLYSAAISVSAYGHSFMDVPLNDKLFAIQAGIIKDIADNGSCVIVGRCADYILKEKDDCINLFIYADMKDKIERVTKLYDTVENQTASMIIKCDKKRAHYYNYYTNQKWANIENYDLAINSSTFGIEKSVEIIENFLR